MKVLANKQKNCKLCNSKCLYNPLPPAITSGGNFVRAMLNCCFSATAA